MVYCLQTKGSWVRFLPAAPVKTRVSRLAPTDSLVFLGSPATEWATEFTDLTLGSADQHQVASIGVGVQPVFRFYPPKNIQPEVAWVLAALRCCRTVSMLAIGCAAHRRSHAGSPTFPPHPRWVRFRSAPTRIQPACHALEFAGLYQACQGDCRQPVLCQVTRAQKGARAREAQHLLFVGGRGRCGMRRHGALYVAQAR